jgi:hypothetical protein
VSESHPALRKHRQKYALLPLWAFGECPRDGKGSAIVFAKSSTDIQGKLGRMASIRLNPPTDLKFPSDEEQAMLSSL